MVFQHTGGNNGTAYLQVKPGTNYTVEAGFTAWNVSSGAESLLGIGAYDNGSDKLINFFMGADEKMHNFQYSPSTYAFNSRGFSDLIMAPGDLFWLRMVEDATHRTFYASNDGYVYRQVGQVATGTYITPTHVGIAADNFASVDLDGLCFHLKITSP